MSVPLFSSILNTLHRKLWSRFVAIAHALIGFKSVSISVFISISVLSACASSGKPPVKESTKLNLTVQASEDVNSTEKGAAPVMVRLYELKTDNVFLSTDFFSLQQKDKDVLGSDLLARDETILRPGDTFTISRPSSTETVAIGVLAGYQNLSNSTWRAIYKIPEAPDEAWYRAVIPTNKVNLLITVESNAIKVTEQK